MKRKFILILIGIALLTTALLAGTVTAYAEDASDRDAEAADFKTIGNVVTFGRYEQDNNLENGPEPIQWIVLDADDEKALLFSKYGLDTAQYNTKYVAITWEKCTLRSWLNNEFMNAAFSAEEQEAILLTDVDNSASQAYGPWHTKDQNNTQDKIYLLSYAEANKYLGVEYKKNKVETRVVPTAYALGKDALTSKGYKTTEGTDAGRWWLRSPGRVPTRAAHVWAGGSLADAHVTAYNWRFGGRAVIRPVFWLNLESDAF